MSTQTKAKPTKLTKQQLHILGHIAANRGPSLTVYMLGRGTCEALRKRGLVTTGEANKPIDRMSNPYVYITEAGRSTLAEVQARGAP